MNNNNIEFKVVKPHFMELGYSVLEIKTIYGERISAYESEPDKKIETKVFEGTICECDSFIRLVKNGYLKL